ncbi:endomucin [Canis lupus familiaris]|uniref:Endomucin n=1 Tax=Canis lupus familiaris TaxID=9615 RepID=A0A8P0SUN3_CANLF|nr:endomucin [Canis lupus familiaris]XP_852385.1 endomucin [Canis lupus familiaris]|eukprot:XP_852385.1 endomucin [Canis lupus familiaris]
MKFLQVTILCLLLPSLCSGKKDTDVNNTATLVLSTTTFSAAQTFTAQTTPTPKSNPVTELIGGTSSTGIISKKSLNASLGPTHPSLLTTVKSEGTTTSDVMKTDFTGTDVTVTKIPLLSATLTLQSPQHKTENQSLIKSKETPASTLQPDASPSHTSTLLSISVTIPGNISQFQGTEDAKNASSSSASPSYSSVILPVVIALIVVTLSAFVLVGLYRMCWKADPGTPENGNDQPQSDKESVKLLTVKTISHESGEHSAQGKSKN